MEKLGYGLSGHGYYARRIVLNAVISLQVCDTGDPRYFSELEWRKERKKIILEKPQENE